MTDNLRHAQYRSDGVQIDDPQHLKDFTDPQIQALVSGAGTEAQPGEVGVVNAAHPVGDVRRYGVVPDAVKLPAVSISGTVATATPGTFTSAMVDMMIACRAFTNVFSRILTVSADGASCTLQTAAAASYSGPAVVGTNWEDRGTTANVYTNLRAGIRIVFPAGLYNTGLNFGGGASDGRLHFEVGSELVSIMHLITDGTAINRRVVITGRVTTYDRFGTIKLQDNSYTEAVHVKDGTALGLPKPRGAHLYDATSDYTIDNLEIDGCSAVNGEAALAIDDSACARIRIGRTIIKDSDVHGLILMGTAHELGYVEIQGYGEGTYTNSGLVGSSIAQSMEFKGAWLHRSPETKIETLRIDQKPDDSVSCVTVSANATLTAATAGGFANIRVGQRVSGSGIADHSLASCSTTSASATVTGSGFSALSKGQPVSGTGIPGGALILSIASDTSMTLNLPATASGTVPLTVGCVVRSISNDYSSATISNAATASGTATRTFSRPAALYTLLTTDSGLGDTPQTMHVGSLIAKSVARRGISIGDRNFTASCNRVRIGAIDAAVIGGNVQIDTGYQMLHVNAVTNGPAALNGLQLLRAYNNYGSDLLFVAAGAEIECDMIDVQRVTPNGSTVAGRLVQILGRGRIGEIRGVVSANSASAVPITVGPANDGPVFIGPVNLRAVTTMSIRAVELTSAVDFEIGPVHLSRYGGTPAIMVDAAQRGVLKLGVLTDFSGAGWGVRFQNNTGVQIVGGKITGFAKGTTGSSANNTRCSARGLECSGNTANTDLANGQLLVDSTCLNATL